MINTLGKNVSSQVIPLRTSAVVGLRLLRDLIYSGRLARPKLIYLDAAHMCRHAHGSQTSRTALGHVSELELEC